VDLLPLGSNDPLVPENMVLTGSDWLHQSIIRSSLVSFLDGTKNHYFTS